MCACPISATAVKNRHIHISMLSYDNPSYAANGLFVGDAKLLLCTEGFHGLERKTVAVKPRPGAKMTCFGWEADGAVVNGTYAFSLTSIVAYSVIYNCTLPQPLAQLLQSIPVQFTKHDSRSKQVASKPCGICRATPFESDSAVPNFPRRGAESMHIPAPVRESVCKAVSAEDGCEPCASAATTHGGLCDQIDDRWKDV